MIKRNNTRLKSDRLLDRGRSMYAKGVALAFSQYSSHQRSVSTRCREATS